MKKLFLLVIFVCAAMFAACEYDDSALWGEIDGVKQELADHERRIAALEELCKQMNTNISALQTAVTALQNNDFITNVAPITKDGETIGYTVTFSKSGSITIYNGEDGKDGADGEDAVAPVIGVKQDSDGVYYWTLDGEWLTDDSGNKIKAEGKDGKDGEDATDGEDGVTPQLKIENDYWYVSYDNGATWKRLGKATGDSSTNVTDCNCIIKDVRQDDNNVYFELTDGTIITIPKSNGDNNTSATLPPSDEIWYTSTDGKIVTPNDSNAFGANIVSNTYENGKGVIKFDGDVTKIGDMAFYDDCANLTSITIPDSVTEIGYEAFRDCSSLTSATISDSVTEIGVGAFFGCSSLTSITIPDSVTKIGGFVFHKCSSLTGITIPDSVTQIGEMAFAFCGSLTSVTIPDNVTVIGQSAFASCSSLTTIIIPNGVTEIDGYTFFNCSSLTTITIPDGVTEIGWEAFYACSSLTSITIPDSVTKIGESAFKNCSSLKNIYCMPKTPPTANKGSYSSWGAFDQNTSSRKIYVPAESADAYKTTDGWKDYADAIEEKAM